MSTSGKKPSNKVFIISLVITLAICLWGILGAKSFGVAANGTFDFLVNKFGWFYMISMFAFVIFSVGLAASKYGTVRLGPDDSRPEYSYISWFAMLFSAGMGIGLVFWGVAEPLNHFMAPMGVEAATPAAADFAIKKSFFHWGLHPWANYSVLALAMAYMQFRKNKKGLVSSIFIPLIGEERVNGPIGNMIDILAIFATVAGVATSLGLGTYQINSGLHHLFGLPETVPVQIGIVVIVTILFMISAISGLDKGIKFLSNLNISIAGILMLFAFIVGPSIMIINSLTNGMGMYFSEIVRESLHVEAFGDNSWLNGWTIFYWAWWIAWAPFVGTFIARISRGRTIREFILGVMLVPALGSFVWFAVFGTLGINVGLKDPSIAAEAIKSTSTAFFVIMSQYPMGSAVSLVAVVLLITFFVTSADSATFVLGMMSSDGDLNPTTTKKVAWGCIQSLLALSLMIAGGQQGLLFLQIGSVAAAFPFAFIMVFAMAAMVKALKSENVGAVASVKQKAVERKAEKAGEPAFGVLAEEIAE